MSLLALTLLARPGGASRDVAEEGQHIIIGMLITGARLRRRDRCSASSSATSAAARPQGSAAAPRAPTDVRPARPAPR